MSCKGKNGLDFHSLHLDPCWPTRTPLDGHSRHAVSSDLVGRCCDGTVAQQVGSSTMAKGQRQELRTSVRSHPSPWPSRPQVQRLPAAPDSLLHAPWFQHYAVLVHHRQLCTCTQYVDPGSVDSCDWILRSARWRSSSLAPSHSRISKLFLPTSRALPNPTARTLP